jgi:hypothetical protein
LASKAPIDGFPLKLRASALPTGMRRRSGGLKAGSASGLGNAVAPVTAALVVPAPTSGDLGCGRRSCIEGSTKPGSAPIAVIVQAMGTSVMPLVIQLLLPEETAGAPVISSMS